MPFAFPTFHVRALLQSFLSISVICTASGAAGQENTDKNSFADADTPPSYQARCHEIRELTKDRETGANRIDFSALGPLALVHFDGTLAYLGLCGDGSNPKVLCITYNTNDMKVGEEVVVTGGYSRPNPDFIVLDPCLAHRLGSP
ncbi:hypothetical protein AB4Y85_06455 [Microvirga sp. 2YAF29]|uniref:hypothetical protein n=1 Tax=Microvirga sp. 2YAF29 TaxID=3233031 RepID=UPI003F9AC379